MDPATARLRDVLTDPARLEELETEELAELLAELEALRARAWARLSRPDAPTGNGTPTTPASDRMLDVEEAAELLAVEPRWLYDRADDLPFTRRLAPRTLRFSERALYRWLETRR